MTLITLAMVSIAVSITCAIIAFFIGVWYERVRWNDLIKKGVIPAPNYQMTEKEMFDKIEGVLKNELGGQHVSITR